MPKYNCTAKVLDFLAVVLSCKEFKSAPTAKQEAALEKKQAHEIVCSVPWYEDTADKLRAEKDGVTGKDCQVPKHTDLLDPNKWKKLEISDPEIAQFCPSGIHHVDGGSFKPVLAMEFVGRVCELEKYKKCRDSSKLFQELKKDFYTPTKDVFNFIILSIERAQFPPMPSDNSLFAMHFEPHAMGATTRDTQNVVTNNNGIDGPLAQRMSGGSAIPPNTTNITHNAQVPQDGARPPVMNTNNGWSLPDPASMQRIRQPSGGVPPSFNPQQSMPSRPLPASVRTTPSLGANNPGQGAPTQLPQQPQQQHPSIDASFESVGENNTSFQSVGANASFERGAGDLSFSSAPSEIPPSSAANPLLLQHQNVQAATGQPVVNRSQDFVHSPHSQASIAAALDAGDTIVANASSASAGTGGELMPVNTMHQQHGSYRLSVEAAAAGIGRVNLGGQSNPSVPGHRRSSTTGSYPNVGAMSNANPRFAGPAIAGDLLTTGLRLTLEDGNATQNQQLPPRALGNGAVPTYQQQQQHQQPLPSIENGAASYQHHQQQAQPAWTQEDQRAWEREQERQDRIRREEQERKDRVRREEQERQERTRREEQERQERIRREEQERQERIRREEQERQERNRREEREHEFRKIQSQQAHERELALFQNTENLSNNVTGMRVDLGRNTSQIQRNTDAVRDAPDNVARAVANSIPPPSPATVHFNSQGTPARNGPTPLRSVSQAGMHTPASRVSTVGALFPPVEDDLPVNPESDKCDGLKEKTKDFCTYPKKYGRYCGQHRNFPEKYASRMRRKGGGGR